MNSIRWLLLSCVLLAGVIRDAIAADNDPHLVGWWKFDEASGTCAADSSRGEHNGVLEGGLTFDQQSVPGRIGKAIQLDGAKNCIRIAGYKGVTGTRPRTLAVWIKTPASAGEVVSWGLNDHGQMWTLGFIRKHLGVTPKGGYLYMKDSISDDTWHQVVAVVLEASLPNLHDNARLYKDGEPAVIDDIGLLDLWPIETGDKQDVTIGLRFKGALDDLRIYDRVLSEDEVKALFKSAGR
jgi:Concanavalin A-like lectin/glucanases superfamily